MSLLENHFHEYASPARVQRVSVIYLESVVMVYLHNNTVCQRQVFFSKKTLIIKDEGANHLDILTTGYDMLCQALLGKIKSKK